MTPTGLFLLLGGLAALLLAVLALVGAFRSGHASDSAQALASGDLSRALSIGLDGSRPEDLIPAAFAARHLLELETAHSLLERALAHEPDSGEAWLEYGLTLAEQGRLSKADDALLQAGRLRSDLIESVTLHRAWVALLQKDGACARRLFEEVEAPLENKLRSDLGSGYAVFCDWFLQAAQLWDLRGDSEKAKWAHREARRSAPESLVASKDIFPPAV